MLRALQGACSSLPEVRAKIGQVLPVLRPLVSWRGFVAAQQQPQREYWQTPTYQSRAAEGYQQVRSKDWQAGVLWSSCQHERYYTDQHTKVVKVEPEDDSQQEVACSSGKELKRRLKLPVIHPKAIVTSEEHPCGAEHLEFPFSAKAFYVGKDLKSNMAKLLEEAEKRGYQRVDGQLNPLICLRASSQELRNDEDYTGLPCETYIVALDRMEAVVFFNGFGREREIWEEHTGGRLTSRYIEEMRVTVIPDLEEKSQQLDDGIVLQQAELNNIKTIAFVLAQTVALHFYEMQVDHMLKVFEEMNVEMERTGSFRPAARKEELLQMVAKNNLLFTDIISKLGIMERFDVAWKNNDCNDIYEHLRGDLEIENRNSNLQIKLNLVQENVKYFLELMQNQKSDFLEWTIIILIALEIILGLVELMRKH